MAQDAGNLIWIDMEMSGLDPEIERVLEVAIVITDSTPELNTIAEAPVLVVHQEDAVLARMDEWNRSTHGKSGLTERVKVSTYSESDVEDQMLAWLAHHVPKGVSPMCGNSVHQDRRFLAKYMPRLEEYFLYRNLDVSTLKELWRRWKGVAPGLSKQGKHEALADIHESIDELRYYREHFLKSLNLPRGGTFLHTLVWLAIMGGVSWLFYGYMQGELNPNRVPEVTGSGEIVLKRNRAGHFVAGGAINGHKVTFLVDTGATQIAVPQQLADKLDLKRGLPVQLMTAAGAARGYMTRLETVDLGTLHLKDANAIVAEGLHPEMVLLGMNFLRHIEITQRGDELILRPVEKRRK